MYRYAKSLWLLLVVALATMASGDSDVTDSAVGEGSVLHGDSAVLRRLLELEHKLAGAIDALAKQQGTIASQHVTITDLAVRVLELEREKAASPLPAARIALDPRISTLADDEPPPPPNRRRTTGEGPAADDIPGVPITADEVTKTLKIGGTTEVAGDMVVRGRLFVGDTQVGPRFLVFGSDRRYPYTRLTPPRRCPDIQRSDALAYDLHLADVGAQSGAIGRSGGASLDAADASPYQRRQVMPRG